MKFKRKILMMFVMCISIFSFGIINVNAAGEHQFIVKTYDWNALDNDWEGSGTGEEILSGSTLEPGQVIQVSLYYIPGTDTDLGFQMALLYDNTLLEPMTYYDEDEGKDIPYVETDMSTTYQGGIWPAASSTPAGKKTTNWTVISNHVANSAENTSRFNFLVSDETNAKTLETEGVIASVYLKVKESVSTGSLNLRFDETYTAMGNKSAFTTTGADFTIQAEVSDNTALHTLTATGNGTIYTSPDFVADSNTVKEYSMIVPNSVEKVDLQATATEGTVLSGTLGEKTLNIGKNDFTITVSAASGKQENYIVSIYRLNNDATLETLSLTNDVNIGTFASGTTSYTATVPYTTTNTTISAKATDANATITGAGEFAFTNYGNTANTKDIVVKAENCDTKYASVEGNTCTTNTYTITVNRQAPSSNNYLSSLKVNGTSVDGFDKETTTYTLDDIKDDTTSLTVEAIAEDKDNATVTITGADAIKVGDNTIKVTVTAQDKTTKEYKINVRKLSSDSTLKSLSITNGVLDSTFSSSDTEYTVTMNKDVTNFNKDMITAVANDSNATITYSDEITINGDTTTVFNITVKAENDSTSTYKLNVKKSKNNDATLSGLSVAEGTLSPGFASGTTSYTVNVGNEVTKVNVTATANDSNADVEISGADSLKVGNNTVTIKVTAEDNSTGTYTITVVREGNDDATLKDIKLDGTLIDGFASGTTTYTLEDITTDITKLNITATANDSNANVTITGADAIKVGNNTITIKVVAENGTTTQTYTINVKKLSGDNTLKSLSVTNGKLNTSFVSSTREYTVNMNKDVTIFNKDMITAVANHEGATIIYDTEKDINSDTTTAFVITVTAENGVSDIYTLNVTKGKNDDATLKDIKLDGTLIDGFASGTTSYTVNVGNEVTSVNVTATANDTNANVKIEGVDSLKVGENTVTITVTAEDNSTNVYTVKIVREGNDDATLKDIKLDGTLIDGFASGTTTYTLEDITTDITKLNITATANDSNATVTITGADAIKVGDNTITIKVVAENGTTTNTYTINVKKLSGDNTLKSLSITNGKLNTSFVSSTREYTVNMNKDVTIFNKDMITAVANHEGATIIYDTEKDINSDTTTAFVITVTAENGVSDIYTLNVTKGKNDDATLKDIKLDGTLIDGFASGTTSYTVNVGNEVTSVNVTATANDTNANVKIEGVDSLKVGENTVTITVTAEDNSTNVYTVKIVREGNDDATLKDIKLDGTLIDGFASGTTTYTLEDITTDITKLNITATANDSNATVTITGADAIKVGDNTITITVVAEDGKTTNTYTINVKKLSSDNTLKSLSVNKGTLNPTFVSGTKEYTVTMEEDVTTINESMITAVANHEGATIVYDTEKTINTSNATEFIITVTSESGLSETYKLNVIKAKNSNATLSSLSVDEGTLSPAFASGTTSYTVNVGNEIDKITVNAEATDSNADVEIEGADSLEVGENTVTITVTSEDGTPKVYTIKVIKAGSSDATLKSIKVNDVLITGFDAETLEYTLPKVDYATTTLKISAEPNHSEANVEGTGNITLKTGNNVIELTVTAEDGTPRTYKINVEREANNDATLKSLSIGSYKLSPDFNKNTLEYTITVTETTEVLSQSEVKAEATDANATITLDADLSLSSTGNNVYNIKVVAEDGKTTNTYKVNVIKPKSTDATLKSLNISGGILNPAFTSGQKTYDVTMPNGTTKFNKDVITAVANHAKASIAYSNEITINSETATEFVITVTAESGATETYRLNVKASAEESLNEITSTKHTIDGDNIKTVKVYETALELKNNLDNENEYLEVWSADEKTKIADNEQLATGMIVKLIKNGKELDRKLVVIKGDTSGDGEIDLFDAVMILNHYLEKSSLKNAYLQAAYVNPDTEIDLFDAVMILNHYLGKTSLH